VAHGLRSRHEVALTFHGAGDPALAQAVLGTLERRGARVTVLAVGTWLAANPQLARRIVGAGHELGNHTWTHPVLDDLSATRARVEIERCRDLLERLTGSPGGHVRQSGGQHATPLVLDLAGAAGYPVCLSYDVDSLDWTDPGPAAIRRNVAASVRPGSVVSLHLGHPGTLTALPSILADLGQRGLRPVTATTLLAP
jgi:peptidoglycan/xylan/chitin deacetylase (PgdA/CDA1 family)